MDARARYFNRARPGRNREETARRGRGGEMWEMCARRDACVGLNRETTGDVSRARRRIDAREGRG